MALTSSEVLEAIRSVTLTGQSYTLSDGQSVTKASLKDLWTLYRSLQADEQAAAQGLKPGAAVFQPVRFGSGRS